MQTNTSVKYLTLFSAFMLPLTLVTWFFWMNLKNVPFDDIMVYLIFVLVTLTMVSTLFYLIRRKKL
jgi:Mg2+ and Co2+ transporter CorA